MNLPYIAIILNGIDNITTYLMLGKSGIYEINPVQKYFIEKAGLLQFQVIEFSVFAALFIPVSYFFYRKSKIGYYVLNGLVLGGFLFTVITNILLIMH